MILTPRLCTVALLIAALGFGLAPWFARGLTDAGMAPPSVAFFRFLTTAIVLLVFLNFSRGARRPTLWALLSGIAIGVGWITYVHALSGASVATVGVVYMTYPLFTLVIAWAWVGQPPTIRSLGSGGLVLVAAIIALAPSLSDYTQLEALLFAFCAPIGFGFAICVLTTKLHALKTLERSAAVSLGAVIGLTPLVVTLDPSAVFPSTPLGWWMIIGIGVVTALLPNTLFALAGPIVGSARTAAASSFELPVMFLVGLIAFDEKVDVTQVVAAILIIIAILMSPAVAASRNQSKNNHHKA